MQPPLSIREISRRFVLVLCILLLIAVVDFYITHSELRLSRSNLQMVTVTNRIKNLYLEANVLLEKMNNPAKAAERDLPDWRYHLAKLRQELALLQDHVSRHQQFLSQDAQHVLTQPPNLLHSRLQTLRQELAWLEQDPEELDTRETQLKLALIRESLTSQQLLTGIDQFVLYQQQHVIRQLRKFELLNLVNLVFMAMAIGLFGVFIFKPLLRQIVAYTSELELANDRLSQELSSREQAELSLEGEEQNKAFLFSTLAHDLKTPITADLRIYQQLRAGQFGPVTPEQQVVLCELIKSGRILRQMIDNLLTSYKLQARQIELCYEPVDLNQLIHTCVGQELQCLAEDKHQTLSLALSPLLPLLSLDPVEMRRVLTNLISNAIKFTPRKGTITLTTDWDATRQEAVLTLSDTGVGIPQELQEQVFQAYSSLSRKYKQLGTGLGLYISRAIIELHGGSLALQSQPGEGSSFTLRLPQLPPPLRSRSSYTALDS